MHIIEIGFINTTPQKILLATGSNIKNRTVKKIEDGINQFNKMYLQRGFKITHINDDIEFEPLRQKWTILESP